MIAPAGESRAETPGAAAPRRWPWLMPVLVVGGVFGVLWVLLFTRVAPNWDGAFYYAYARSLVFDGDWQLANDLQLSYPTSGEPFASKRYDLLLTATGYIQNPFAPGMTLLWSPWLATLRALTPLFGWPAPTAYEWPFTLGAAALSALAGLAAFGLAWRLAAGVAGRQLATLTVITLLLTTPLLHYQFREPYYAHATAALVTAVCVVVWYAAAERPAAPSAGAAFSLGALIGLAALVRWQHLIYLALPVLSILWHGVWRPAGPRGRALRHWGQYGLALVAGTGLLFSLQLGVWRLFYGSWITIPQGESFMAWNAGWLRPMLFSTFHGLFTWMPVAAPAIGGLAWLAWRRPAVGLPLLVVFALQIYVNASTPDWFGGGGFGPRRFTSELALLAIGYAAFLAGLPWPRLLGALLGSVFAWHQWTLLRYGLALSLGGQVVSMGPDFQWADMTWGAFGRQLWLYGQQLWRQPGEFFLFQDAPLQQWQQGQPPLEQGLALLGAVLWVGLLTLLYRLTPARLKTRSVGLGLTLLLTALAHLWLIWRA